MSVIYEACNGVARLTLNRPEVLNALNPDMYAAINASIERFEADTEARVGIITGAGRGFCAGADLRHATRSADGVDFAGTVAQYRFGFLGELSTTKPLVAAINGPCVGDGLVLALLADLRVASTDATFMIGGVRLGLPSVYEAVLASRRLLLGHVLELLTATEPRSAEWAYRTGLVNEIAAPQDVMQTAESYARNICLIDPVAFRATRELMVRQSSMSFEQAVALGKERRAGVIDPLLQDRMRDVIRPT